MARACVRSTQVPEERHRTRDTPAFGTIEVPLLFFFTLLFVTLGTCLPMIASVRVLQLLSRAVKRIWTRRRLRPILALAYGQLDRAIPIPALLSSGFICRHEGFEVQVSDSPGPGLTFRLKSPVPLPQRMLLDERGREAPDGVRPLVRTYDASFDSVFFLRGRPADVLARLGPTVRQRLLELAQDGTIRAEGTTLILTTPALDLSPTAIVEVIRRMASLAKALFSEPESVEAGLLANARDESSPAVRYQLLDLLLRNYARTPEADAGLVLADRAPERGIRFLAATRQGALGLPLIEEIVSVPGEPDALREMSLRHLAWHAPRAHALPILRRAVASGGATRVVRTAIELLGRLQDREAVSVLIAVAKDGTDSEHRARIADALGLIGAQEAEPFLIKLLDDPSPAVKVAGMSALGRVGSVESLHPLRRFASRTFIDRDIAIPARAALARIEGRLGPRESGRLSFAPTEEASGALSLDPGDGTLSFAPAPEAQTPEHERS